MSHLKGFFSSAASSPALRFSKIGKTGGKKRVSQLIEGPRLRLGATRRMSMCDARLGALASGRVSPGWSRFRLTEEEDAPPCSFLEADMLMILFAM